jgi:hypothetical protein
MLKMQELQTNTASSSLLRLSALSQELQDPLCCTVPVVGVYLRLNLGMFKLQ